MSVSIQTQKVNKHIGKSAHLPDSLPFANEPSEVLILQIEYIRQSARPNLSLSHSSLAQCLPAHPPVRPLVQLTVRPATRPPVRTPISSLAPSLHYRTIARPHTQQFALLYTQLVCQPFVPHPLCRPVECSISRPTVWPTVSSYGRPLNRPTDRPSTLPSKATSKLLPVSALFPR